MNWVPIAERELLVAARKPSTVWLRVGAAITSFVLGGGCLVLLELRATNSSQTASALFYVLTWTFLAAALAAGLFLTADCLSEEKREGTLGLLFLTQLRGHDVILGKLLATSLRGFYALLAILPIIAISQLLGSITAAQYWKSCLALVNGLFFSLAAGMLVSAVVRDSQRALALTLLLVLVVTLGGPLADQIIAASTRRGFRPLWSVASPGYVLILASAWGRSPYWSSLAVNQLLGWLMLGLACLLVPHSWRAQRNTGSGSLSTWQHAWRYGGQRRRERIRRRLLGWQPMVWLVSRERWQSFMLWTLALLAVSALGYAVTGGRLSDQRWILWNFFGGFFTLILYLLTASQAVRFFTEARRSGLLELLLATPLTERQIIFGQWRALWRMFGLPVALLLSLNVLAAMLSQRSFQQLAGQASAASTTVTTNRSVVVVTPGPRPKAGSPPKSPATSATARPPAYGSPTQQAAMAFTAATAAGLSTAANLLAVCWFGFWMGLTSRSASLATLKTILFVQIIPWFVIAFGSNLIVWGLVSRRFLQSGNQGQVAAWVAWFPFLTTALSTVAALVKDAVFIVWSRDKLLRSLREVAAINPAQARVETAVLALPPAAAPQPPPLPAPPTRQSP